MLPSLFPHLAYVAVALAYLAFQLPLHTVPLLLAGTILVYKLIGFSGLFAAWGKLLAGQQS